MDWNVAFRKYILGVPLRLLFPVQVVGRENLPPEGPYIIAPGPHTTEIESALIASHLSSIKIRFFAKAEYWKKSRAHDWFMTNTGQVPLSRTDSRQALEAIEVGANILKDGGIMAIYPEGTRSLDGRVHKGHTGVARTAIRAGGVPIVPVGLIGMRKLNPPGGRIRPGRATMVIGEPINPLRYQGLSGHSNLTDKALEAALSRSITDALMKRITTLSGAEYVNEYIPLPSPPKK